MIVVAVLGIGWTLGLLFCGIAVLNALRRTEESLAIRQAREIIEKRLAA